MSATICGAPWVHAVAPCKFDLHVVGEWSRRQSQHCSNCRRAEEVGHPVCFSVWIRRSRSTACSACDTKRSPTKTNYFVDAKAETSNAYTVQLPCTQRAVLVPFRDWTEPRRILFLPPGPPLAPYAISLVCEMVPPLGMVGGQSTASTTSKCTANP